MTKDFVSILDLMPKIFELAKRDIGGFFNVRRYPSRGDSYQYDVVSDNEQKQLMFFDTYLEYSQVYSSLSGEPIPSDVASSRERRLEEHTPYVLGYSYDVPEILEVYYLRNSKHFDYLTEAYLKILENLYYQYVLAYVRSCDERDRIHQHAYATSKESNIIYRALEDGDMIFQLNPEDDNFAETVKQLVLDKAEALSKVKKTTKSDKGKLGYLFYPSRNLDDLLDYHEFFIDRQYRYTTYSFEGLTQYFPMLILFVAIEQDRQTYIGASYPEYVELTKRLPVRVRSNTEILPADWDITEELEKHKTLTPDDRLYIFSYGTGVGFSSSYSHFYRAEYIDGIVNQAIYMNVYNQIRLMMFGEEDVPVPIDSLSSFENEPWRENAGLRLSLNASNLDWSESDERD